MKTEEKPDIELNALGAGCLASCGSSCLGVVSMCLLIALSGVQLARVTPDLAPDWIKIVGFLFALAIHGFAGYVVARAAKNGKMFHALIYGCLMMLLGVLSFVLPNTRQAPIGLTLVSWLLTLPMTLLGAKRAIDREY